MDQIKSDASSFFLWEDSADSEVDSSGHRMILSHPDEESAVDDQEDARSCCCDDASERSALDHNFQDDHDDDEDRAVGLIGDGDSDQLDGRGRSSGQMWGGGAASECESGKEEEEAESSNVGAIPNMNEMEDKVFWDTCMAGGYP